MLKSTTEIFIRKSILVHEDRYDYDLVKYINNIIKIKIKCLKTNHGIFEQTPAKHLSGRGCPLCAYDNKRKLFQLTLEQFIKKAKEVHSDRYDYSKVDYINSHTKIIIICKEHGEFKQSPSSHLQNHGCSKCGTKNCQNTGGWTNSDWYNQSFKSSHFDSFKVYIIRCWNEQEEFYKIGKTFKKIEERFHHKKLMPYNYEIIKIIESEINYKYITKLESLLHKKYKYYRYTPKIKFSGYRECFMIGKNNMNFDGRGMVSENEDLQIEALLNYDLIDDYTESRKKEFLDYLGSHIEWEHIELDLQDNYLKSNLKELDYFELKVLAEEYDY